MRNYVTEFLGTFFLVLTIGLVVTQKVALAPIPIGIVLAIMVYMGGHISGAHYNPAVSLAIFLRGRLAAKDLIPYWISQLVGAIAAAALVRTIMGVSFPVAPAPGVAPLTAVLVEIVFTFALALVVLNVATAKSTAGNSFYGFAIGGTVLAAAFAGGAISGGAFNPAVGIGPNLIDFSQISTMWIYIVGPLVGGIAAAVVFKVQNPNDA